MIEIIEKDSRRYGNGGAMLVRDTATDQHFVISRSDRYGYWEVGTFEANAKGKVTNWSGPVRTTDDYTIEDAVKDLEARLG